MTLRFGRLFVALLALALVASACGLSGDDTDEQAAVEGEPTTDAAPAPSPSPEPPESAAEPAPDAEGSSTTAPVEPAEAPVAQPADPTETTIAFVRNTFNIDPDADALSCVLAKSASDPVLSDTLASQQALLGQLDDVQLKTLTYAINGCVDPVGLGDWATQAVGPTGDVADTAPACFSSRFGDADTGNATLHSFVALVMQFRLEPDASPNLINALVECTPITALAEFFAGQEEQSTNFVTVVDRDCLLDAIDSTEASSAFWTAFVDGGTPPASIMEPYLASCSSQPESDLALELPADFVPWSGTGSLSSVSPPARANAYTGPPPMAIDPTKNYEAVFTTGGGEIRIQLFADTAPVTVNNFVSLARDGYYDGTVFHRVLDGFMAQGGDPTASGSGGPGYQFEDEFNGGRVFDRRGLLAMANAGPATNGSQFFITFVPTENLNDRHTIFGEVTEGQDIVDAIERRDPGAPTSRGQVLESVRIVEN